MKYYKVIGKDKHIPKTYYCPAESVADAKIDFYLNVGTDISYVFMITKKEYNRVLNS